MPDEVIISADTRRADRLPPGQVRTPRLPIVHAGEVPAFDPRTWDLTVFPTPLVSPVARFTWDEFTRLPRVRVFADLHSVTGVSRLDNLWEGVATRELLKHVMPSSAAKFVMVHCEYGYSTNLPVADFFGDDCLFALKHDAQDLTPDQGYPVRLVVPRLYDWKSARRVRGVEFMTDDRPGFWEGRENGYHLRGDPWTESRFRSDDEREQSDS